MAAKDGLAFEQHDDGSVSVGVTLGGKYVPIASQPANVVRHYVEDVTGDEDGNGDDDEKGSA